MHTGSRRTRRERVRAAVHWSAPGARPRRAPSRRARRTTSASATSSPVARSRNPPTSIYRSARIPRFAPNTWPCPSDRSCRPRHARSCARLNPTGSTVPSTRSAPAAASSSWDVNQCRGTSESASVEAIHQVSASRPSSSAATPSRRAVPTRPCRDRIVCIPAADAISAVRSVHRSSTTTVCTRTPAEDRATAAADRSADRQAPRLSCSLRAGTTMPTSVTGADGAKEARTSGPCPRPGRSNLHRCASGGLLPGTRGT